MRCISVIPKVNRAESMSLILGDPILSAREVEEIISSTHEDTVFAFDLAPNDASRSRSIVAGRVRLIENAKLNTIGIEMIDHEFDHAKRLVTNLEGASTYLDKDQITEKDPTETSAIESGTYYSPRDLFILGETHYVKSMAVFEDLTTFDGDGTPASSEYQSFPFPTMEPVTRGVPLKLKRAA